MEHLTHCKYCFTHVPCFGDLCPEHALERSDLLASAALFLQDVDHSTIRVYPWIVAPMPLKSLSDNGGDEDWLVAIPPGLSDERWAYWWIQFIDSCQDPQEYVLPNGWVVLIGSHA